MSYVKTTPSKAIKKKELPSSDTEEVDCVLKNTSPKESEPIAFLCEKEYTTKGLDKRRMTDYISAVCYYSNSFTRFTRNEFHISSGVNSLSKIKGRRYGTELRRTQTWS